MRGAALVLLVAACTVGDTPKPVTTPVEPDPDRMPEAVLDKYDPNRELTHDAPGGTSVCGSWCNPCHDVTRPPPQPGCLNNLACATDRHGGPSADVLVVALAIGAVSRRRRRHRRRRRVYARGHEGDPVLEEHLNDVP